MTSRTAEARRKDWEVEPEADDTAGTGPRTGTAWRLFRHLASHRGLAVRDAVSVPISRNSE